MSVDQRIQTTITAGRGNQGAEHGPIMVILLSCLAVAMCFTTLGMGFVNVASGSMKVRKATQEATAKATENASQLKAATERMEELEKSEKTVQIEISRLEKEKRRLMAAEQEEEDRLQAELKTLSNERQTGSKHKQRYQEIQATKTQLIASIADLRVKLNGQSAEVKALIQARTQLEQQFRELQQQVGETDKRIQNLRKAIEDKKNSFDAKMVLVPHDGKQAAWLECARDGIVLVPQGDHFTTRELSEKPQRFLQLVASRQLEFLIRPDGYAAFRAARDAAEQAGITDLSYEPIDANWRLKYK